MEQQRLPMDGYSEVSLNNICLWLYLKFSLKNLIFNKPYLKLFLPETFFFQLSSLTWLLMSVGSIPLAFVYMPKCL